MLHERREKFVARPPRCILDIQLLALCARGDVHALDKKFQPMPFRQCSHKSLIGIRRAAAQQMIQMNDANNDAEFRLQFEKQAQQGDRVRSTRNRDAHAIARAKKRLVVDSALDCAKQRLRQF